MIADDANTVYEAFAQTADAHPNRPLFNVMPGTATALNIEAGETSYSDARAQVDRLAVDLADAGYGKGMRVALLLENRPVFFQYWLALNKLEASVVPINPDLRAAELEYLIGHSEPALIVAMPARVAELETATKAAGIDLSVITPRVTPTPTPQKAVVAKNQRGEHR